MVDEITRLEEQVERCRRLANSMTDEKLRHSLEELAEEYEARLERQRKSEGFMLRRTIG